MYNKENNFGEKIKEIRKTNNLTQKDLAEKLNVTYQAVSKWERGENYPDLIIIKQIASIFKIDINDLMDVKLGENKPKKNFNILLLLVIFLIFIIAIGGIIFINFSNTDSTLELKTLSTTCSNFNLSGSIAYNKDKSSIHISEIDYCGVEEDTIYKSIKSSLYENDGINETLIEDGEEKNNISLKEYLTDLTIHVDNYNKTCKLYNEFSIYIKIELIEEDNKSTNYTIPLTLNDSCK